MSNQFIINPAWGYLFPEAKKDGAGDHRVFTRPQPSLEDRGHARFQWTIEGNADVGPVRIRNGAYGYLFGSTIKYNGDWTAWCREQPSSEDLASERFQWRFVRDRGVTQLQNLKLGFAFAADKDLDEGDHFVELKSAGAAAAKFSWRLRTWGLPNWMGSIDGGQPLSALTVPGTHDSGANRTSDKSSEWSKAVHDGIPLANTGSGFLDTIINAGGSVVREVGGLGAKVVGSVADAGTAVGALCQTASIAVQLEAGIRFLDIRVRNDGDHLLIFHGDVYMHQGLGHVLNACYDFLSKHPRECVMMSVKRDKDDANPSLPLGQRFDSYLEQAPGRWYTGESVPRLDDVRGKIVLLRRFAEPGTHRGIDATGWKNNATFDVDSGNARLRVQDQYELTSTQKDDKWAAVRATLDQAVADADMSRLYLNFASAVGGVSKAPVPADMAMVINRRVQQYLVEHPLGRYGVVAMDFPDLGVIESLISANFR